MTAPLYKLSDEWMNISFFTVYTICYWFPHVVHLALYDIFAYWSFFLECYNDKLLRALLYQVVKLLIRSTMQLLLQCRFLGNTPKIADVILDVFSVPSSDSSRTPVKYSVSMGKVYLDEQLPAMDYLDYFSHVSPPKWFINACMRWGMSLACLIMKGGYL